MRTRQATTIEDLHRAIVCLPRHTRVAMLEGIRANTIIVGAYSDGDGICPMLAAHRAGGRTDFISFARAWDRFAFRGVKRRHARRATQRELRVLTAHLEASLLEDDGPPPDLSAAIREHRELQAVQASERAGSASRRADRASERADSPRRRPGDPDRSKQLSKHPGWAWMRVVRRLDDYERALELLDAHVGAQNETERELVS